jgi:hypothetical protein
MAGIFIATNFVLISVLDTSIHLARDTNELGLSVASRKQGTECRRELRDIKSSVPQVRTDTIH